MSRRLVATFSLITACALLAEPPPAAGQSPRPSPARPGAPGGGALRTLRRAEGPAAEPARGGAAPAAPETGASPAGGAGGEATAGEAEGLGRRLVGAIRKYATWILAALGAALAASLAWFFLAGRGKSKAGDFLEPIDRELGTAGGSATPGRYSSTKIRVEDVESRLGAGLEGTRVETDREYALVVDQEALKMPPLPEEVDEHTGRTYADDREIRERLKAADYEGAYRIYAERIAGDGSLEFRGDLELELSEHFMRRREFEKAVEVLEHHVATHAAADVAPETYFNLGYLHVQTRRLKKSRRFFKLFVNADPRPEYRERARRILERLEALN